MDSAEAEAFEERVHQTLESIRNHDEIKVDEAYFGMAPSVHPSYLERDERSAELIEVLSENFPLFGRLSLAWHADEGAGGETEMPDFDTISDPANRYDDASIERTFGGPAVVIDHHPRAGDHHLILIDLSSDLGELWVYNGNYGDPSRLSVDFETYQEAMLDFRAGYGWEWLFSDPGACPWEDGIRSQLQSLVSSTQTLFGVDLEPYAARLELWDIDK